MFYPLKTVIRIFLISGLRILSPKNRFALSSSKPVFDIEFVINGIKESQTLYFPVIMQLFL